MFIVTSPCCTVCPAIWRFLFNDTSLPTESRLFNDASPFIIAFPTISNIFEIETSLIKLIGLLNAISPPNDKPPMIVVLPATNKLLFNDTSFITNNLELIDTSSNTRKILFTFKYPSTKVLPAISNVYKYPSSSTATFR